MQSSAIQVRLNAEVTPLILDRTSHAREATYMQILANKTIEPLPLMLLYLLHILHKRLFMHHSSISALFRDTKIPQAKLNKTFED